MDLDGAEKTPIGKIIAAGPIPPHRRLRERDSDQGRWGWVNGDDHRGGRLDDMGELTHPHQEKLSLQDQPEPARNGTPTEDDGGIELIRPIIEKLSLQDLYPHPPSAESLERLCQVDPTLRLYNIDERLALRRPEDLAVLSEGLRKAGLPE